MKLLMYGVNKETIMKEDTAKYFLNSQKKKNQMEDIIQFDGVEEIAILSDDFRNEYYLYVDETIFSHGEFLRYLASNTDKSLQDIILETYSKFNEDVLSHLFQIASGYLSDPIGSFKGLKSVEQSLDFAKSVHTINDIICAMFTKAINLSYDLKLDEMIKPLNSSRLTKYIYILKKHMKALKKKDFMISGNDFEVYYLTKLLLFTGASSVSIINENENEALRQTKQLADKLAPNEHSKLFTVTSKSLYYRLSKMDAAILNTAQLNLFTEEVLEEVSLIRQTKKNQYLIHTDKNDLVDIHLPSLNFKYLDGTTEMLYSDSEINDAVDAYEIKVSAHIQQFMQFLNELLLDTEENTEND